MRVCAPTRVYVLHTNIDNNIVTNKSCGITIYKMNRIRQHYTTLPISLILFYFFLRTINYKSFFQSQRVYKDYSNTYNMQELPRNITRFMKNGLILLCYHDISMDYGGI